ncbi:MAG: class I SAM-dependent RNA methyltransferase [Chloroflexi bacterium]|nr:class I SAM-dependent RNA methyltransferase [Chloroflexota bacterium]
MTNQKSETRPEPERGILNLKFSGMAHGGEGLARDESGRVIFVPYAIAGEIARVEIVEARRGFARGRIVELLEASPARVEPRCPHFPPSPNGAGTRRSPYESNASPSPGGAGTRRSPYESNASPSPGGAGTRRSPYESNASPLPVTEPALSVSKGHPSLFCGGCQWQHIAYDAQLEFKTQIVREQFARLAKFPDAPVLPIIPARNQWFYRNNMQFVVNEHGRLCLQAHDSHLRVPIDECFVMHPALGEMHKTLELDPESFNGVTLRTGENTGDRFIILESDDPETPEIETDEPASIAFSSGDVTAPILGKERLTERVGARTFEISPDAFFQINTAMAEELVRLVGEFLAPCATDVLLDAYGGVGLFGLTFAPRVARVIEIEENPNALGDAQANAADLNNVEFHQGRVEQVLPKLDGKLDLAVVDPPRAGLDRFALDALAAKQPRTLVYVSCDPATLARDAARLIQHGYALERVQPVDMFPQTFHVECVAAFRRARFSGD